jgi:hypothetical protein
MLAFVRHGTRNRNVSALTDKLSRLPAAASLMDRALIESTGLNEFQRKVVTYWTLGTHFLRRTNTYSILALLGKMASGKSQTLSIIENFAYRPVRLNLRGMTTPTIRDKLAEALEGTAIVEEADFAWKDTDTTVERLLSDRYQRKTANASYKVKSGDKDWQPRSQEYFGATVVHRRIPFRDAALDGRTVLVRFRPDSTRKYREFSPEDPWNEEGKKLLQGLILTPIEVECPEGVAGRTFSTYFPLLSAATMWGDRQFIDQLRSRLLQDTLELKEAQSMEPDGLVLRAIVESVFILGPPDFSNVKFSSLSESIWKNHRFPLTSRQIGPIARDLGFTTKESHGMTVVVVTPATLLRACDECGYTDEAIEELRQGALGTDGADQ